MMPYEKVEQPERAAQRMRRILHEREHVTSEIRRLNTAVRELTNEVREVTALLNPRQAYALNASEVLVYDHSSCAWQIRSMCGG